MTRRARAIHDGWPIYAGDPQRRRAYRAENAAFPRAQRRCLTDDETTALVRAAWARMGRADAPPTARLVRGSGRAFATCAGRVIVLPAWARNPWVVIHELAHCAVGTRVGHQWPWAREYVRAVEAVLGAAQASRLSAEFDARGVEFRPPVEGTHRWLDDRIAALRRAIELSLGALTAIAAARGRAP